MAEPQPRKATPLATRGAGQPTTLGFKNVTTATAPVHVTAYTPAGAPYRTSAPDSDDPRPPD